jgi:predicted porin
MAGADSRNLLFDARRFAQIRLDGGRTDLNGYFTFTHRTLENDARNVNVNANLITVGGNWEANPALSVFAEYTRENWGGRTEIVDSPTFSTFAPDSNILTLGANYVIDPLTFLSANVTNIRSENDNPLHERDGNFRGTFFTLTARRRLSSTHEVGLVIAPWVYRDRVNGVMDYDARVIMLTGSARF